MSENDSHNFDIELDPELAGGEYSNLVIIAHSPTEFVFDYACVLPGMPKPQVKSRVILTPEHAKRLLLSLQDNLTRYESHYGQITISPTAGEAAQITMPLAKGEA